MRRRAFLAIAAWAAAPWLARAAGERIDVRARKFEFIPAEIRVARGRPVTLAVTAEDFVHGFSMPDFGIRRDLVPGKAVEVTFTPAAAGRFHYLCDNFCGDGHEEMHGRFVVSA